MSTETDSRDCSRKRRTSLHSTCARPLPESAYDRWADPVKFPWGKPDVWLRRLWRGRWTYRMRLGRSLQSRRDPLNYSGRGRSGEPLDVGRLLFRTLPTKESCKTLWNKFFLAPNLTPQPFTIITVGGQSKPKQTLHAATICVKLHTVKKYAILRCSLGDVQKLRSKDF